MYKAPAVAPCETAGSSSRFGETKSKTRPCGIQINAGRQKEEEGGMQRSVARGWPSRRAAKFTWPCHTGGGRSGMVRRRTEGSTRTGHTRSERVLYGPYSIRAVVLSLFRPFHALAKERGPARARPGLPRGDLQTKSDAAAGTHAPTRTKRTHALALPVTHPMWWVQPRCSAERKQDGPRSSLMPRTPRNLARRRKSAPGPLNPLLAPAKTSCVGVRGVRACALAPMR
jgi:hypothetical protein